MLRRLSLALVLMLAATSVQAQNVDGNVSEVVVTGARRDADGYDDRIPAIGLRKVGDYAVQVVTVSGDTRDTAKRHEEIFAMIKGAIELAAKRPGIELATGEMIVEPLTLANYSDLTLSSDRRPDTNQVSFLVKTRLTAGTDAKTALAKIESFIKAVPAVGRAEINSTGDLTLSVVKPEQYRGRILDAVAADARIAAAALGTDYGVEVKGLDRPVEWSRASLTDVFLYVPYSYVVTPKGR